jgi:hypothetical protein
VRANFHSFKPKMMAVTMPKMIRQIIVVEAQGY